ncbi:MAG: S-layer homology domain-containing protein [Clostridia bacterium]|nr:S-layer homology domain-containing protein [Clostridia bacterium]
MVKIFRKFFVFCLIASLMMLNTVPLYAIEDNNEVVIEASSVNGAYVQSYVHPETGAIIYPNENYLWKAVNTSGEIITVDWSIRGTGNQGSFTAYPGPDGSRLDTYFMTQTQSRTNHADLVFSYNGQVIKEKTLNNSGWSMIGISAEHGKVYDQFMSELDITGKGYYRDGAADKKEVTLTAVPDPGYKFKRWKDASGNELSRANPYTFQNNEGDRVITAEFELGMNATYVQGYLHPETNEIIYPNQVYVWKAINESMVNVDVEWSIQGGSDNGQFTIAPPAEGESRSTTYFYSTPNTRTDKPIIEFYVNDTLMRTKGPGGINNTGWSMVGVIAEKGTVTDQFGTVMTETGNGYYNSGGASLQTVTLTAHPIPGHKLVKWVDEEGATLSTDAIYTFENIGGDKVITAVFAFDASKVNATYVQGYTHPETGNLIYPNDLYVWKAVNSSSVPVNVNWIIKDTLQGGNFTAQPGPDGIRLDTYFYSIPESRTDHPVVDFYYFNELVKTKGPGGINNTGWSMIGVEAVDGSVTDQFGSVMDATGHGYYNAGGSELQTVVLTGHPIPGYKLSKWVDEEGITLSTETVYTFVNTGGDKVITAIFEFDKSKVNAAYNQGYEHPITGVVIYPDDILVWKIVNASGVEIDVDWETSTGSAGSLIALPGPDGTRLDYFVATDTVGGTEHFRANFYYGDMHVKYKQTNNTGWSMVGVIAENGSVTDQFGSLMDEEGHGYYNGGGSQLQTVTLTASPDMGYRFVKWLDEENNVVSMDAIYSFVNSGGNKVFTAVFEFDSSKVNAAYNQGYTHPVTQEVIYPSDVYVWKAVNASGLPVDVEWTSKGEQSGNFVALPGEDGARLDTYFTTTPVTRTDNITVKFYYDEQLVRQKGPGGINNSGWSMISVIADHGRAVDQFGTVIDEIGKGFYNIGDTLSDVALTAQADSGYRFVRWETIEGDVISTDLTYSFNNRGGDKVFVAVFELIPVTPTPTPAPAATPLVSISLDTNEVSLEYGTEADEAFLSYDFTETILNSTSTAVTWTSDNEDVATVDDQGVVTAVSQGETVITVTHNSSGATARATVIVFLVGDEETPLGAVDFNEPYISGYPDGTFKPLMPVTRAEVASMFARILKMNLDFPGSPKFVDLVQNKWYFASVQASARAALFDTSKPFRPNDPITRAELADVFANYLKFKGIPMDTSVVDLNDVPQSHWASEQIYALYNLGVLTSFEDGTFKPDENTLREQVVVLINTLIGRPAKIDGSGKFTDVTPSNPAFGDIEAASNMMIQLESE